MRPSDMWFLRMDELPEWLVALARQLPSGGDQTPPEVLSPVPLLEEIAETAEAIAAGRRLTRADRASLAADVEIALDSLGARSTDVHAAALGPLRAQVARRELLADPADAPRVSADARALLLRLHSAASRVAAFDDCLASFAEGDDVGVCELRLAHLRAVVEASGHDWNERTRRLHDALTDEYAALADNGALDPGHGAFVFRERAGMTIPERLDLCRTVLAAASPPAGPATVWLAYANAFVEQMHLTKGPVEFYDGRIWSAVVSGNWPGNQHWSQPAELASEDSQLFLDGLPDGDFVMVRVSLPSGPIAQARAHGRDLARAALDLVGWESSWVLLDGEAVYARGGWFGTAGFTDPRRRALDMATNPVFDPLAHVLTDLDQALLERLADGDPRALELVADTRWRRAVASLPDVEHRVALTIALFERVLAPRGGENWHAACRRHFAFLYAFDEVAKTLWDTGFYATHPLCRATSSKHVQALASGVVVHSRGLAVDVRLDEVIRLAPKLLEHAEPGSLQERMWREVVRRTRNGPATARWIDESRMRFCVLLDRARRQRNAVVHGTRTIPTVIASVEPFLDRVAGRLVGALQRCVIHQLSLPHELEQWRALRVERHKLLVAGAKPQTVLIRQAAPAGLDLDVGLD